MTTYSVELTPDATTDLEKLTPTIQERILRKITAVFSEF